MVDEQIKQLRTNTLDLSINELVDMYTRAELIISPEYQSLSRWDEQQQSQFIESLILELPVPPLFVIEKADSVYELIDGLQRLSSYLHFHGSHPDYRDKQGNTRFLILTGCHLVKELNNLTYEQLPQAIKIKLKYYLIRLEIIKKESDKQLHKALFKKLHLPDFLLTKVTQVA
ncbi:conserved hypothetical protein [Beggiatoa sp. PS]|nr:conserved hypothetical protein [Beggiatoa sp. PS]